MRHVFRFLPLILLVTGLVAEDFVAATFAGMGGELPYRVLKPTKMAPGSAYPLVVFLHGAGERGTDNQAQLKWNVGIFAKPEVQAKFPCFVIAPQCPPDRRWVEVHWGEAEPHTMPKEPSVPMGQLMALLPQFMKENPVDRQRVYVIGLSMGGFGTWDLLARMPTSFAAGIPICGGADNRTAPLIATIPVWVWHGDKDGVVPTIRSRSMVEALRAAGGQPRYQELAGVDHFAWVPAFEEPTILDWLFAQRRSDKPQKAEKPGRSANAKNQLQQPGQAITGLISSGQRLAFLGDSITQFGWEKSDGYVKLVVAGLAANGMTVEPLPAGVSGQKSNDMLSRIDRDVLSRKPAVMTLSCGVNDVWHQERGVGIKLEDYRKNITAMLDAAAKAKVAVVVMTATPIGEALDNENNAKLAPYNAFLRSIARERGLPLADAAADLQNAIVTLGRTEGAVTADGVHMNALGNRLMARAVLRALGLEDAQLVKAEQTWHR